MGCSTITTDVMNSYLSLCLAQCIWSETSSEGRSGTFLTIGIVFGWGGSYICVSRQCRKRIVYKDAVEKISMTTPDIMVKQGCITCVIEVTIGRYLHGWHCDHIKSLQLSKLAPINHESCETQHLLTVTTYPRPLKVNTHQKGILFLLIQATTLCIFIPADIFADFYSRVL